MRKIFILQLFLLVSVAVQGQGIVTFDEMPLPGANTDYTQTIDTGNYSFAYEFENRFYGRKEAWGGYSGFTYSNVKDSMTAGPENDRAAFPATGARNSAQYAIAYGSNYGMHVDMFIALRPAYEAHVWGMYITNATYAVRSMENGDDFAKKFGGADGTDPDWFLLTIKGYNFGSGTVDSVEFYLADFRSDDPTEDYIVKDWRYVTLESLGMVDSLSFSLSSSDNGEFGMNTPAYFCIDEIGIEGSGGITGHSKMLAASIYPNPASDMLYIKSEQPVHAKVYDLTGKIMLNGVSVRNMDITALPAGSYLLFLSDERGTSFASSRFIKK